MRKTTRTLLGSLCAVVALMAATGAASARDAWQCVPFARMVSGIQLFGDAWTWWDGAPASRYERGDQPQLGAVLVLRKTRSLFHGHVAVVTNLIGPREILVTHANWGNGWAIPGVVYSGMRAVDDSPLNDWTAVRFWNAKAGAFGRIYPAYGFVYRQGTA